MVKFLIAATLLAIPCGCSSSRSPQERYDQELQALQGLALEADAARLAYAESVDSNDAASVIDSRLDRKREIESQFYLQQQRVDEARREMTGIEGVPSGEIPAWIALLLLAGGAFWVIRWVRRQNAKS